MIKIDKGIPVPAPRKVSKYPFRQMHVGDSFFSPGEHNKPHYQKIYGSYMSLRARGWTGKITVRFVKGGVRCWRSE